MNSSMILVIFLSICSINLNRNVGEKLVADLNKSGVRPSQMSMLMQRFELVGDVIDSHSLPAAPPPSVIAQPQSVPSRGMPSPKLGPVRLLSFHFSYMLTYDSVNRHLHLIYQQPTP